MSRCLEATLFWAWSGTHTKLSWELGSIRPNPNRSSMAKAAPASRIFLRACKTGDYKPSTSPLFCKKLPPRVCRRPCRPFTRGRRGRVLQSRIDTSSTIVWRSSSSARFGAARPPRGRMAPDFSVRATFPSQIAEPAAAPLHSQP
jgi:hypothetical protein